MNDGELWVVSGSSRSGKSVFVQSQIRMTKRGLVWDVEAQYSSPALIRC